jgi:O-antigen/teichoic acid export membrane protein
MSPGNNGSNGNAGGGRGKGRRRPSSAPCGGGNGNGGATAKPEARGSGAALGEKVLRLSSIHTVGLFVTHAMTLITAVVVAVYLGPSEFGQYGLLLFAAGFLSFLFNLGSKQGTLKRVFGGGDDDDEDDDDDDEDMAESRQRALGTGIVLTLVISIVGTAIFVLFAGSIASFLLKGTEDRGVIILAGLAGGFGAVVRLGSLAVWMEHRPIAYIVIDNTRAILALAIALPLLIAGTGVSGAIAGYAIASAVAAVATLWLLRHSLELCFEWNEVKMIMRRGITRVPIVASMWAVGYMDLFLLSRYVSQADLGVYHLASKAGFVVAFLPAGYRKALRPLRKTPAFHAAEEEYGQGTAAGMQLGYFLLMLVGVLLAITLFSRALSHLSPTGYGPAARLIPLLSAGLVAPTVYRMLSKTSKFKGKPRWFIGGAVGAALLFIGGCVALIPLLGIWAPPVAMIVAFAIPASILLWKGQHGRSPAVLPKRQFFAAAVTAIPIGLAYYLLDPPGPPLVQFGYALLGTLLWLSLLPFNGAIPTYHRRPLADMGKALFGRGGKDYDEAAVIESLSQRRRRSARLAIPGGKSLEQVSAKVERDPDQVAQELVRTLRLFAADGGMASAKKTKNDAVIGRYLFSESTPADRGAYGKELMKSGLVQPGDLLELEKITEHLRTTKVMDWRG